MTTHAALHWPMTFAHVPHKTGAPIVDASGLVVRYNGRVALDDITFQLAPGERVAVVGPNGAGKTTLFKVIAGLLLPTQGDVKIFGFKPGGHICIAYVVQRSQVDWTFPLNVEDAVMMGRDGTLGWLRRPRASDRAKVRECLDVVGLRDLAQRQIGELSGGEQQRMFIARALAMEAELMLMDEPFTGLDVNSQRDIIEILKRLSERHVTVMVALHDLNLAAEHFGRALLLNQRLMGIGAPKEIFTPDRLIKAYGSHARRIDTREGVVLLSDTCCEGDHGAPRPS